MNSRQAKSIPLANILAGLGHQPHHQRGNELWYCSPFRNETEPSFQLNVVKNIWRDFGLGHGQQGGTVVDFALTYWNTSSVSEALRQLAGVNTNVMPNDSIPLQIERQGLSRGKSAELVIDAIKELQHPVLKGYLADRAIPAYLARQYVKEIHFTNRGKSYYAIAFPNDSGGYEVRNKYYQACLGGGKDISTIGEPNLIDKSIAIFEGFTDYLSYLTHCDTKQANETSTTIVMNSTTMVDRTITAFRGLGVEKAMLYLDRDEAGRTATQYLQQKLGVEVIDKSRLYEGYKDFNAWWMKQRNQYQSR